MTETPIKKNELVIFESDDTCALERYEKAYDNVVGTERGEKIYRDSHEKHGKPLAIKLSNSFADVGWYDSSSHAVEINPSLVQLSTFIGEDGVDYPMTPERILTHESVHSFQIFADEELRTVKPMPNYSLSEEEQSAIQEGMQKIFAADTRAGAKNVVIDLMEDYPNLFKDQSNGRKFFNFPHHEAEAIAIANEVDKQLGEGVARDGHTVRMSQDFMVESMLTALQKPLPTPEECKPNVDGLQK